MANYQRAALLATSSRGLSTPSTSRRSCDSPIDPALWARRLASSTSNRSTVFQSFECTDREQPWKSMVQHLSCYKHLLCLSTWHNVLWDDGLRPPAGQCCTTMAPRWKCALSTVDATRPCLAQRSQRTHATSSAGGCSWNHELPLGSWNHPDGSVGCSPPRKQKRCYLGQTPKWDLNRSRLDHQHHRQGDPQVLCRKHLRC